nr:hypothetical protein [Tanacetum cinerariifolium]
MILRDGDERLTLNIRHDTSSYSKQPQKESINMFNIFNDSSEDFLKDLFSTNQPSGNPTFLSHPELTLPEVKDDIFDPDGGNFLSKKLLDLDSTKDLHPPLHVNPLSGNTTYSSSPNQLLEMFTNEHALDYSSPPLYDEYDDDLQFDIESDLKEIEFLLHQDIDSNLKDSIDQSNLANPADIFVDFIPEMVDALPQPTTRTSISLRFMSRTFPAVCEINFTAVYVLEATTVCDKDFPTVCDNIVTAVCDKDFPSVCHNIFTAVCNKDLTAVYISLLRWFKRSSTNARTGKICSVAITFKEKYDSPAVEEQTILETLSNVSPKNKANYDAEKEAIHLLLTGIRYEIYSTINACKTAHEIWIAIERLQQGESLNKQDYQNEFNEIRAEKIAKNENLLALVAAAQQYQILIIKHQNECKKPKRVKYYAYHKEKMLLCKQAEKGFLLQEEQADWLEDTDEEVDE